MISSVRVLEWEPTTAVLLAYPPAETAGLWNATLLSQSNVTVAKGAVHNMCVAQ